VGKTADVPIENMKKEDLDQVLGIEQASFSMPWSKNLFLSEFRSPGVSSLFVSLAADTPGRIVTGYIVFWHVEDEMHILNLAVAPDYRRLGIARQLVLAGVHRAYIKGARRAFLEVRASNTPAQKLYSDLGFSGSSIRRDYYDSPLEDAVVMTLEQGALERIAKNP
jgi:ribosomal-protein-alanine N-acetyltransferase